MIPEHLQNFTTAKHFIPTFVSDLNQSFSVERLASEIISRAQNHHCDSTCDHSQSVTGKRTSTLAAASIYLALRLLKVKNVDYDDVAACAQIVQGTMKAAAAIIESHWTAMFADEKNGVQTILDDIKAIDAKLTQSNAVAPTQMAETKKTLTVFGGK